jgi:hypothetical protein
VCFSLNNFQFSILSDVNFSLKNFILALIPALFQFIRKTRWFVENGNAAGCRATECMNKFDLYGCLSGWKRLYGHNRPCISALFLPVIQLCSFFILSETENPSV